MLPAGKPVIGVQVSTVPLASQLGNVMIMVVEFEKIALVAAVYMGALNLNTTVVLGDTLVAPLAGVTLVIATWACATPGAGCSSAANTMMPSIEEKPGKPANRFLEIKIRIIMTSGCENSKCQTAAASQTK